MIRGKRQVSPRKNDRGLKVYTAQKHVCHRGRVTHAQLDGGCWAGEMPEILYSAQYFSLKSYDTIVY